MLQGRVMILMAGWRFGVQYIPVEQYGCITDVYSISRNVTETEWNLPFTYNIACGLLLLFVSGGLPLYLCFKAKSIKGMVCYKSTFLPQYHNYANKLIKARADST